MGSLCSKSSNYEGGHTVLGSGPVNSNPGQGSRPRPSSGRPDPRAAAAEAAERRLQAVSVSIHERKPPSRSFIQAQNRGVNDANPKQGKLASQLAKQNSQRPDAQRTEEQRLVVSTRVLSPV